MHKTFAPLLFVVVLFTVSCKKSAVQQPKHFSSALLTAHAWQLKTLLYRQKSDTTNNDFTSLVYHDCERDDLYTFATDSIFNRDDNIDICVLQGQYGPYGTGTWRANSDLTHLSLMKPFGYDYEFVVLTLTETDLILEYDTKDVFQNDVVYTYEFEAE
jgi:hypothetical protein